MHSQKNSWDDTEFCLDWSKKNYNLELHVQEIFTNSIKDLVEITWLGVPYAFDIWQPVDGGYATTLKTLINQEFFNWLDDEDNVGKWYVLKVISQQMKNAS